MPDAASGDTPFDYHRYLASREWAIRREAVRVRSLGVCERCHLLPMAQVHHLTYARIGREADSDLQGLCAPCHEYESGKRDIDPRETIRHALAAAEALLAFTALLQVLPDEVAMLGERTLPGVMRHTNGECWLLVDDRLYTGGLEPYAEPQARPQEEEPPRWVDGLRSEAPLPQRFGRAL